MILDKEIEITIGSHNYKYLKELGYPVENKGQRLIIKIKHVPKGSTIKINVQCDICRKNKLTSYNNYIVNTKNFTQPYCCCSKCGLFKQEQAKLKKYGNKNYNNLEKNKQTKLQNHGDENYNNRKQAENTCLEKFGTKYPAQNEIIKNKVELENIKKYGFKCSLQNENVKEKSKQTLLRNYGVEYPGLSVEIKDKIKQKNLKKYGIENYTNRKKANETCNKKYGGNAPACDKEIVKKIKQTIGNKTKEEKKYIIEKFKKTCQKNWGVDYPMQNQELSEKQLMSGKKWKFHEQTGMKYQGNNEKDFLDFCFKKNILVTRGETIWYKLKDKKKAYHPDFYLKEKNLIIEIKSTWYYNLHLELNLTKQKACLDQGYGFIFIIDMNYEEFNCNIFN